MFRNLLLASAALGVLGSTAHAELAISNDPTANVSCSAGVCSATAADAVLNASDLAALLAAGDVTVNSSGATASDIALATPFTWTSAHRLTLDAYGALQVRATMKVPAGAGLSLTTNDGGNGGDLLIAANKRIQFKNLASTLNINGASYALVGSVRMLARAIARAPNGNFALANSVSALDDGEYGGAPVRGSFGGVFEGLGNTISNLDVTFKGHGNFNLGLFASLDGGTIRDIGLTTFRLHGLEDFKGRPYAAGGLVVANNGGTIAHSWVSGSIDLTASAGSAEGGLVMSSSGTIEDCRADVAITTISSTDASIGEMAGNNSGQVRNSFSQGVIEVEIISGSMTIGGLIGVSYGDVSNSYSLTDISQKNAEGNRVGGLIGVNGQTGTAAASYAAGSLKKAGGFRGGFFGADGHAGASCSACYWDLNKGVSDPHYGAGNVKRDPGITGLKDKDLKAALPAGLDPAVWAQDRVINNGYPYLIANPPQ